MTQQNKTVGRKPHHRHLDPVTVKAIEQLRKLAQSANDRTRGSWVIARFHWLKELAQPIFSLEGANPPAQQPVDLSPTGPFRQEEIVFVALE